MDQEVKEVDVAHPEIGFVLLQVIQEKPDVFADAWLILRCIIEDVKGNLIANTTGC